MATQLNCFLIETEKGRKPRDVLKDVRIFDQMQVGSTPSSDVWKVWIFGKKVTESELNVRFKAC